MNYKKVMLVILVFGLLYSINNKYSYKESVLVKDTLSFMNNKPEDGLLSALNYYNVLFPDIVYAQAVLETGHFTSNICNTHNNLFGLYNSKTHDYYHFNHWSESVKAYIDCIQYKYEYSKDYYEFLSNIGYAEDPEYINKLKILVKQYDKRRTSIDSSRIDKIQ